MTYPAYQTPPPPQQWVSPPPPPTTPARFGKIGFWLLVGGLCSVLVSAFALPLFIRGALGGGDTPLFVLVGIFQVVPVLMYVAATTLGIIGLVKRERPMWWSILATGSFAVAGIMGFIITMLAVIPLMFMTGS